MSRKKLIKQLKDKNPKLNNSELIDIIDVFSKNISDTLKSKNSAEIRGLGRLYCKKLKAISRHGVGYDNIDLNYIKKKDITLLVTATANAVAVTHSSNAATNAQL